MIVHLVTDRRRLTSAANASEVHRCLMAQARHAIEAGIDVLQIRERDLEAADLSAVVADVVKLARGSETRVLVNDRVDVALASGADGVHLPADAIPPSDVRRMVPDGFVIGRSVHTLDDLVRARGADYLIAGTLWPSESKPGTDALLGLGGLTSIVRAVIVPVLAIGGVTIDRVGEIPGTGAAGVAAIGLFMGVASSSGCRAASLAETVSAIRRGFDTPRSHS